MRNGSSQRCSKRPPRTVPTVQYTRILKQSLSNMYSELRGLIELKLNMLRWYSPQSAALAIFEPFNDTLPAAFRFILRFRFRQL